MSLLTLLSKQDIVDTTGTNSLDTLVELEILFLSFDEISSLDCCTNLKKLTLLDNGLKRISNLVPVSRSLISLCLCDQNITKMENLDLPLLRELFLHRNRITHISGLNRCPRLRKLWLFQNKLTVVTDLHSTPELEECWLQANQISSLAGFEHNTQLLILGMAGNPVTDFDELTKLSNCISLRDLSFSDIHFGRSPVVDCVGYKEFVTLHLRQIRQLDGVKISKDMQLGAEEAYLLQVESFNASLREVENNYVDNIRALDSQHQSKENYGVVLEKEMAAALREMQTLVMDGRAIINKQVSRHQSLLSVNLKSLTANMHGLEKDALHQLNEFRSDIQYEADAGAALLFVAELVAKKDSALVAVMSDAGRFELGDGDSQKPQRSGKQQSLVFQPVISSAVDFQLIARHIQNTTSIKLKSNSQKDGTRAPWESLELTRLYKLALPSSPKFNSSQTNNQFVRAFIILPAAKLQLLLKNGWSQLGDSCVFSENAGLLGSLFCDGDCEETRNMSELYRNGLGELCVEGSHVNAKKSGKAFKKFEQATKSLVFYVVCCTLCVDSIVAGEAVSLAASDKQARQNLVSGLQRRQQVCQVALSCDPSQPDENSVLYVLPPAACVDLVQVNFVGLCLTPALEEGVHTLENRLELLSLPTHGVDRSSQILNVFDEAAALEVKQFVARLLEEVDEVQAQDLVRAEKEVDSREAALKYLRDEIEQERRRQENTLRDMRQSSSNEMSNSTSHHNSSSKLPLTSQRGIQKR